MSVKPEEFQKNVRSNKSVLKEIAALITEELQTRIDPPSGWDFRFALIVAQWLVEQGRYTMEPQGYNPGNVMGSGDAGYFTRPDNTEVVDGVRVPRPDAHFAAYSSMKVATRVKFDTLRDRWPQAYSALLRGASSDEYVNGLYPGKPKNYATESQAKYVSGLRWRLRQQVIPQYILTCQDDIKEMDEMARKIPDRTPLPGESLDYRNDVKMNQNMRSVLVHLLDELKKLQQRVNSGKGVQG